MRRIVFALFVLFGVALVLSSCSKPECEISSDCPSAGSCYLAKCQDGKCIKSAKPNCCGNMLCEQSAGENPCTCKDCGVCESKGKIKYNISTPRGPKVMESKYARYVCNQNDECVVGAAIADINQQMLTSNLEELQYFKAEVLSTFNNPFNTATDAFSVRIKLTDLTSKVNGGIRFTNIQVLSGNSLMGERVISSLISSPGQSITEQFSLISSQSLIEEDKLLSIKLDYEFDSIERDGLVTKRLSKKMSISNSKVTFIVPD